MATERYLIITADDFGIGPAVSRGILDLAERRLITCSVLLVNSPYAGPAVRAWRQAGRPMELGWHPCLTLDRPVLPAERVRSLVGPDGQFWPLGRFLSRVALGRIDAAEVKAELRAQWERFGELVGHPPTVVNSHQHCSLFRPVGVALLELLAQSRPLPYVRRVREPWRMLWSIPRSRGKRLLLSVLGQRAARRQEACGFPGNDWLAGISNPQGVADLQGLPRWLAQVPGQVVELVCHPGYFDRTLLGRDCTDACGAAWRVQELQRLRAPGLLEVCRRAGFTLVSPGELIGLIGPRQAAAGSGPWGVSLAREVAAARGTG
ncbi:MAG: ChbG/HpnK family deacetylase [Gemmataceae bacterium]|nr:ChbG/HpnK family deacetylase [Gemmataceae bacterium]